jgi:hypothetical protein
MRRLSHTTGLSGWCFFSPEWSESRITGTLQLYLMCGTKLRPWLRSWSSSVCINKDITQVFPSLYDFFVCKWSLWTMSNVIYIAKHLIELGAQLRKVLSRNRGHKQLDLLSLSCPVTSPLTNIWTREPQLQQVVLWKLNLIRSYCQISGLGCAQSILPWQIALLRNWCPLQPRNIVREDSRPSLAWKLNTGTDSVWKMILDRLSNTTQHWVMCIISSTPFSLTCGESFTMFDEQIRFYM